MKVVKITDGLGNQIFQYAFARKMQIDTDRAVYLDTRFINNEDAVIRKEDNYKNKMNGFRHYGLDKFKIKLKSADDQELRYWQYLSASGVLQHEIYTMAQKGMWPWRYYDEDFTQVNKSTLFPAYYKGYFFNLNYYDDIRDVLQKEIVLKNKIHLPEVLKNSLKNENTVSLHVRRGDFIRLHIDISRNEYYPNAISLMESKLTKPTYFVFSDDIEWVKSNLKLSGKVIYVSDMGFQDYEELMIMKHCKHNIIANSTFSYWAAYLNSNPDKIVICPHNWKINIIPKDWIRL